MTPHQFKQTRKLYGQTQAEWALTLGFEGQHAYTTINRYENARIRIPGPIAKLVAMLADAHLRDMRERLIPSDLVDIGAGRVLRTAPLEGSKYGQGN